jgi:hypothetical protein
VRRGDELVEDLEIPNGREDVAVPRADIRRTPEIEGKRKA